MIIDLVSQSFCPTIQSFNLSTFVLSVTDNLKRSTSNYGGGLTLLRNEHPPLPCMGAPHMMEDGKAATILIYLPDFSIRI